MAGLTLRDFRHFLRNARGSALELETEILIAIRQHYVSAEQGERLLEQTARVGQLINGLIRNISKRLKE
jgi:four helix bundle protein